MRGFARYMAGIDPRAEIPPAGLIRQTSTRRPPLIYTDDDILALLEQARRSMSQPLRAVTMETRIGLLASTDLRVGEALRLDRRDVDWQDGVLHIFARNSESLSWRRLCDTIDALERYTGRPDRPPRQPGQRELLHLAARNPSDPLDLGSTPRRTEGAVTEGSEESEAATLTAPPPAPQLSKPRERTMSQA